ncbi:uncharacterized protein LOC129600820 [Paramacrobiotus metropolitanus]|uniref:uncharacterized protein LOC129600820 n=1 Tax=Paramacrobiotus metropolitanus TaxID=2943436 RepID=UPI0024458318|nr:uncharacterized protein LOC129600820 [Paramacrobiotus metropolitanus]
MPAMNRHCTSAADAYEDDYQHANSKIRMDPATSGVTTTNGIPTICLNTTGENPSVKGLDIDRRCICRGAVGGIWVDRCNYFNNGTWDNLMGLWTAKRNPQFVLMTQNYTVPFTVAPGSNSLANLTIWSSVSAGTLPTTRASSTSNSPTFSSTTPEALQKEESGSTTPESPFSAFLLI